MFVGVDTWRSSELKKCTKAESMTNKMCVFSYEVIIWTFFFSFSYTIIGDFWRHDDAFVKLSLTQESLQKHWLFIICLRYFIMIRLAFLFDTNVALSSAKQHKKFSLSLLASAWRRKEFQWKIYFFMNEWKREWGGGDKRTYFLLM